MVGGGLPDFQENGFTVGVRAIRIRPDFFEAHMAIGVAWKRRGEPDKAEQAFARAHELSPQDPSALFSLGVLAAEQGKVETAVEMFQKTLSVDPSYKPASDALAHIAERFPDFSTKQSSE